MLNSNVTFYVRTSIVELWTSMLQKLAPLLHKLRMIGPFPQFLWSRVPLVHFVKRVGGVGGRDKPTQGALVSKFLPGIFMRWIWSAGNNWNNKTRSGDTKTFETRGTSEKWIRRAFIWDNRSIFLSPIILDVFFFHITTLSLRKKQPTKQRNWKVTLYIKTIFPSRTQQRGLTL